MNSASRGEMSKNAASNSALPSTTDRCGTYPGRVISSSGTPSARSSSADQDVEPLRPSTSADQKARWSMAPGNRQEMPITAIASSGAAASAAGAAGRGSGCRSGPASTGCAADACPAGASPAGSSPVRCRVIAATDGCAKTLVGRNEQPKSRLIRSTASMAANESPPMSKKPAPRSMSREPSTSSKIPRTVRSMSSAATGLPSAGLSATGLPAARSGTVRAASVSFARSTLPCAVSGKASRATNAAGSM
ncbi:hypothetical protein SCYAM73S_07709 [Streptomyces cyaneofuscatus]